MKIRIYKEKLTSIIKNHRLPYKLPLCDVELNFLRFHCLCLLQYKIMKNEE